MLDDGLRVIAEHTTGSKPHFLNIINRRSAAPVSYMTTTHRGDVAGSIKEVVVIRGPNLETREAVQIRLGPLK